MKFVNLERGWVKYKEEMYRLSDGLYKVFKNTLQLTVLFVTYKTQASCA